MKTHLNEAEKRAYVIADNQLGTLSDWDDEALAAEYADLRLRSFTPSSQLKPCADVICSTWPGAEIGSANWTWLGDRLLLNTQQPPHR